MSQMLWLRCGDMDNYIAYDDDLEAVIEALHEAGVHSPLSWFKNGFTCPGFEGKNYISLYWGDGDGNLVRELFEREREAIIQELEGQTWCRQ
jgi:hypothetical protein